ncbi:Protein of unknown function (DUF3128) [Popillia japonica]|uniref:Synaptic plasticity regulator PANTS n=1 Tax=Popillia japonica TaxID=7064 RepID=A0AAW1JUF6_POPJA
MEEAIEDEWMIRPCETYKEEYSDCRSIRSRFQQYFVFGHTIDCSQWKRDADNCYKWTENRDLRAAKNLINSEKERRLERLRAHYNNNVWEKRQSPPADWNKPLPDYLQKEYEYTYLNVKSKEMRGEVAPQADLPALSCTII